MSRSLDPREEPPAGLDPPPTRGGRASGREHTAEDDGFSPPAPSLTAAESPTPAQRPSLPSACRPLVRTVLRRVENATHM